MSDHTVSDTPPDETLLQTSRFTVVRRTRTGRDGAVHARETIVHPGAVVVLPLLDDDRVVLIHNHRVAVGETLLELPAGTLEPPEPPLDTARRELIEETGYRCATLEPLLEFFLSPGILNERMHLFVARGLTEGEPAREPGEEITCEPVTWEEAMQRAADGRIRDAKTLVALLYYDRFRV